MTLQDVKFSLSQKRVTKKANCVILKQLQIDER